MFADCLSQTLLAARPMLLLYAKGKVTDFMIDR